MLTWIPIKIFKKDKINKIAGHANLGGLRVGEVAAKVKVKANLIRNNSLMTLN